MNTEKRKKIINKIMSEWGKLAHIKKPKTSEEYKRMAKIRWDRAKEKLSTGGVKQLLDSAGR